MLVRLENIEFLSRTSGFTKMKIYKFIEDYLRNGNNFKDSLNYIFELWNEKRDYRPIFAGF